MSRDPTIAAMVEAPECALFLARDDEIRLAYERKWRLERPDLAVLPIWVLDGGMGLSLLRGRKFPAIVVDPRANLSESHLAGLERAARITGATI